MQFKTPINKTRLLLPRLHLNADFDHGMVVGAGSCGCQGWQENGQTGGRSQKGNSESDNHWVKLMFECRARPALNQCVYAVNIHLQPLYLIPGGEQGAPQKMSSECMYLCIYVSIISTSAWEEDIAPLHFYCSLEQLWVGSTLGLVILTRLNNRSKIDVRSSGASETQTLKLTTCATCW